MNLDMAAPKDTKRHQVVGNIAAPKDTKRHQVVGNIAAPKSPCIHIKTI